MYNSMIEAIKEESVQLLFHVDIEQVARTEDLESEQDEDAAVDAAESVIGIDGSAGEAGKTAVSSVPSSSEDGDDAGAAATSSDDYGQPAPGVVGPAPLSHAEGKVPANKRPKSEELKTPWADGKTFPGTAKNASCPCGSGRKYKMCHGQNEK
jgi:preprotein translocase subunit SecA